MSTKKQKLIKWKILCPQIEHYRAVLSDLQRQRNVYSFKINEKEIEKYQQSNGGVFDGNYSNRDGEFNLKESLKVVAFIPGTNSVLGTQPCTYVVYKKADEELETDIKVGQVTSKLDRKEKDWYLQALEVTRETIEYVLSKPDPQNYYVHWSG